MIGSSIESTCTCNLHYSEFFCPWGAGEKSEEWLYLPEGEVSPEGGGGPRHIFDTFNKKINIF